MRSAYAGIVGVAIVLAISNSASRAETNEPPAALPFVVYTGCGDDETPRFAPRVLLGWRAGLRVDPCWEAPPARDGPCVRIAFRGPDRWGGVVWTADGIEWGSHPGGVNLTGATRVRFFARGLRGGEEVEFRMGFIDKNNPFPDRGRATTGRVRLTREWREYEMSLEFRDLTQVMTPFGCVLAGQKRDVVIFVDAIRYE